MRAEFRTAVVQVVLQSSDEPSSEALVQRARGVLNLAGNGRLGYVQGPGSKPADHQPVKATDTAAYGVGGFLIAGAELTRLYS